MADIERALTICQAWPSSINRTTPKKKVLLLFSLGRCGNEALWGSSNLPRVKSHQDSDCCKAAYMRSALGKPTHQDPVFLPGSATG